METIDQIKEEDERVVEEVMKENKKKEMRLRTEIQLLYVSLIFCAIGMIFMILSDWRIALGVFLFVWGDNIIQSVRKRAKI